jgi:hypothetical protein
MSIVITICVKRHTLSDGSYAFDVCIGELVLAAHRESDAWRLAEDLRDTIHQHTCPFRKFHPSPGFAPGGRIIA